MENRFVNYNNEKEKMSSQIKQGSSIQENINKHLLIIARHLNNKQKENNNAI
jgi:hypothetical protein